jgi:hypothetical protein
VKKLTTPKDSYFNRPSSTSKDDKKESQAPQKYNNIAKEIHMRAVSLRKYSQMQNEGLVQEGSAAAKNMHILTFAAPKKD